MVLLISYDLNKHERPSAYQKVEKMIADHAGSGNFTKALYSQWLVDTSDSATLWSERMKAVTDENDLWLVSKLNHGEYSGWLNTTTVDWLDSHI